MTEGKAEKVATNRFDFIKQCQEEGLTLWECPNFLFLFTGLISLISIVSTYYLSSIYLSAETVIVVVGLTSFIMMIISFLVNQGITKIAQAKKRLSVINEKLSLTLEEARKANKMREDFTTMLVHDLRSPLDAIRLIIEMIQQRKKPLSEKEFKECFHSINQSTTSMVNLVTNLLDVAKLERGKFVIKKEPNNIEKVIDSLVKNFNLLATSRGIKVSFKKYGDLPFTSFDEYALNRVLSNLFVNAIKFTLEKGKIVIQAVFCPSGKKFDELVKRYRINWFIQANSPFISSVSNSILVAITDNGIGIPKDKLDKLFLSFYQVITTEGTVKTGIPLGTGLGLAIVKVIIKSHGGIVNVASVEDKGSTFYFSLPKI